MEHITRNIKHKKRYIKQGTRNSVFHVPCFMFYERGIITPMVLVIASIMLIFAATLINWSVSEHKDASRKIRTTQALQIAEAGVNYYKWHLEHDESDYQDGNDWCCGDPDPNPDLSLADCGGVCGPYDNHPYLDYNKINIGYFSLRITPPEIGSTVVAVESTGYAYNDADNKKKIIARVGKRSLAEYSFLSNTPIWIGLGETTSGPLHSNDGIRFDDTCNAEVTSAVESYSCVGVEHSCSGVKPGVWGSGGPTTYWRFPAPAVDYDIFTVSLADILVKAATESGVCNGDSGEGRGICFEDSGAEGYMVEFLSDATVNIFRVDSLKPQLKYWDYPGWKREAEEIQNKTLLGNYNMPDNGLVFIEDDVWVEGNINGKVTLAVAKFPENSDDYARIRINDNIQYLARDGNHILGLISQGDLMAPRHAPDNLTVDATLLSQKGHVYFRDYKDGFSAVKDSIEIYGGIITNLFWTWSYVDGGGVVVNGYNTTSTIYNNNLTFSPPPSFPTADNFEVLSWDEE